MAGYNFGNVLDDDEPSGKKAKGYDFGNVLDDPKDFNPNGDTGERTLGNLAKDTGVALLKTAVNLPETAIGIADIPTFGYAGKLAEALGVHTKQANEILDTWYSSATQNAKKEFQQADGIGNKIGVIVKNPFSLAGTGAIESLSSMLAGGFVAKGAKAAAAKYAGGMSDALAGGIGEGLTSAGQTAEQIRQEDPDGTLDLKQNALALGSGALTGAISNKVGKIGDKLGIGTPTINVMRKMEGNTAENVATAVNKNWVRKSAEGFALEAGQETLQSGQEQITQNLGTGKNWSEGVEDAALLGGASGGILGAGSAHFHGGRAANTENPTGPTQSNQFAKQAFADLGPDENVAQQQQKMRGMLAASLSTMTADERQQAITAMAGGDADLAAKLTAVAQDQALVEHGWSQSEGAGLKDFLDFHHQIRQDSGQLSDTTEPSANKVADQVNTQQAAQQGQVAQQMSLNEAGFVPEHANDLNAQLLATKDGRIPAFFAAPSDIHNNGLDLTGLHQAVLTDPNTGHQGIIASKDLATVQKAVELTNSVGLKQAVGTVKGYVDPTATSTPSDAGVAVQHVDQNGNIVNEQAINDPAHAANISPIDGTTIRMQKADDAIRQRIDKQNQQLLNEQQNAAAAGQNPENNSQTTAGATAVEPPSKDWVAANPDVHRLVSSINTSGSGLAPIDHSSISQVSAPTKALGRLAKAIQLAFGTKVVFFHTPTGSLMRTDGSVAESLNGVALRQGHGTIFLNAALASSDSKTAVHAVLGHEMAHVLQRVAPDLYSRIERMALARAKHGRAIEHLHRIAGVAEGEDLSKHSEKLQEARDEIVAEVVGEMATDLGFWSDLFKAVEGDGNRAKSLYTSIIEGLTKIARAFTRTGFIEGLKDLKAVRSVVTQAYIEWSARNESNTGSIQKYNDRLTNRQSPLVSGEAFQQDKLPSEPRDMTNRDKDGIKAQLSEQDKKAKSEWQKKADKNAAVEPSEPYIPEGSYLDTEAKNKAKAEEREKREAEKQAAKDADAEMAALIAAEKEAADAELAAQQEVLDKEYEKKSAEYKANKAKEKADRIAANKAKLEQQKAETAERNAEKKAKSEAEKQQKIKNAADVQALKDKVSAEKATPTNTDTRTNQQKADDIIKQIAALEDKGKSLLQKNGSLPRTGTEKYKQWHAIQEEVSKLRMEWNNVELLARQEKRTAEATSIVKANIDSALATVGDYQGIDDALQAHRQNVTDTMNEQEVFRVNQHYHEAAMKLYDQLAQEAKRKYADSVVKDLGIKTSGPAIVSTGTSNVKGNNGDGPHTIVFFSDGTKARIQKLNSAESMGVPGFYDIDDTLGSGWLADTKEQAIEVLTKQKNNKGGDIRMSRDIINDGSEIGAADDSNVPPEVIHGRNGEVTKNERWKSGERAGQYIGAPAAYNTPAKIAKLRQMFRNLAKEGVRGRFWYEDSGRAVLRFVGGDPVEARKFISLLAIYSPQAKVNANTTMALSAWEQYKAGQPINTKTALQDGQATDVLYNNKQWGGEKTNNFYKNLMREVDLAVGHPTKQGATIDMWMMRAAGYENDAPTAAQYRFVENETNRLAKELGWEPQQVQAAIWTAIKARTENKGVKERTEEKSKKRGYMTYVTGDKGKPVRKLIDAAKHRALWLKEAFGHTITSDDLNTAAYHFGTALGERVAQVSWEATPGASTNILPGIHSAPVEQQMEYLKDIQAALQDDDGRDLIDKKIGLLIDQGLLGHSGWKGEPSVGVQQQTAVYVKDGAVSPISRNAIELALAIRGLVLRQEGMAWHFPIYKASKYEQNGVEFDIGRQLNSQETAVLYKAISDELGHTFAPPIPTANGFRVLNFPKTKFLKNTGTELRQKRLVKVGGKRNGDFHDAVERAVAKQAWFGEIKSHPHFKSDGNLIENDWSKNDSDYRSRIAEAFGASQGNQNGSGSGPSDLLKWVDSELLPRVNKVNERYAEKYGWDNPVRFSRAGIEVVRPTESAGRPSDGGNPGKGQTVAGAIHYGKQEGLSVLSGASFGTGIRGAEQERLKSATDPRIKQRVYFYLPVEGGIPAPEIGLGGSVYSADLSNLYDPSTMNAIKGQGNEFETNVLNAGYSGYINREQGTAVVMGRDVPVNFLGTSANFNKVQRVIQRIIQQNTTRQEGDESVRKPEADQIIGLKIKEAVQAQAPSFRMEYGHARVKTAEMDAANKALEDAGSTFRFARNINKLPVKVHMDGHTLNVPDAGAAVATLESKLAKYKQLFACLG